jgi:hypothetical protein
VFFFSFFFFSTCRIWRYWKPNRQPNELMKSGRTTHLSNLLIWVFLERLFQIVISHVYECFQLLRVIDRFSQNRWWWEVPNLIWQSKKSFRFTESAFCHFSLSDSRHVRDRPDMIRIFTIEQKKRMKTIIDINTIKCDSVKLKVSIIVNLLNVRASILLNCGFCLAIVNLCHSVSHPISFSAIFECEIKENLDCVIEMSVVKIFKSKTNHSRTFIDVKVRP